MYKKHVRGPLTTPRGKPLQETPGDPGKEGRAIRAGAGLRLAQAKTPEWKSDIKPGSWRHGRSPHPQLITNAHCSQQFPPLPIAIFIRTEEDGQN